MAIGFAGVMVLLTLAAIPALFGQKIIRDLSRASSPCLQLCVGVWIYLIVTYGLLLSSLIAILIIHRESSVLLSLLWGTAFGSPLLGGLLLLGMGIINKREMH